MKDFNLARMAEQEEAEDSLYSRAFIKNDDPEVTALQEHFRGVLRALEDSSFSSYPSVAYLKRNHRFHAPLTQEPSKCLVLNPRAQLTQVWKKVAGIDRAWGQQFAERLDFDIPLHVPASPASHSDEEQKQEARSSPVAQQSRARRQRVAAPNAPRNVSPDLVALTRVDINSGISSEY